MLLVQLTDLHVRPEGRPLSRLVESNALTERALNAVRCLRPRPDAVVISGDLTDCGLPAEYELLRTLLSRFVADVPVYLIPGNHDRRENLRAALGSWPGVSADPRFIQYAIETLPMRLVMLDTVVPGHGHGELCDDRLAWLETTLAAQPDRPTVLVMHHPPILSGIKQMDLIGLRQPERLAALLERHGQVERILCGHHHRHMVGRLGRVIVVVVPSVAHQGELELPEATHPGWGRFVMEPPAYGIHLRTADGQLASHVAYVESYPGPYRYIPDPDYPGETP